MHASDYPCNKKAVKTIPAAPRLSLLWWQPSRLPRRYGQRARRECRALASQPRQSIDIALECGCSHRVYFSMPRPDSAPAGQTDDDDEDVRLMRLVADGNTAAFEQLVERHQSLVIGTVARMLGSNSEVEDIAQQVFVRVWKSAGRYVARAKFT